MENVNYTYAGWQFAYEPNFELFIYSPNAGFAHKWPARLERSKSSGARRILLDHPIIEQKVFRMSSFTEPTSSREPPYYVERKGRDGVKYLIAYDYEGLLRLLFKSNGEQISIAQVFNADFGVGVSVGPLSA